MVTQTCSVSASATTEYENFEFIKKIEKSEYQWVSPTLYQLQLLRITAASDLKEGKLERQNVSGNYYNGDKKHHSIAEDLFHNLLCNNSEISTNSPFDSLFEYFPKNKLLTAPLFQPGAQEIIKKVIQVEINAYKKGNVLIWRYTRNTTEEDKNSEHQKNRFPRSFSCGLFSGYINDGYTSFKKLTGGNSSACTYVYVADALWVRNVIKGGAPKLHETVLNFLDQTKIIKGKVNLPDLNDTDYVKELKEVCCGTTLVGLDKKDEKVQFELNNLYYTITDDVGVLISNFSFTTEKEHQEKSKKDSAGRLYAVPYPLKNIKKAINESTKGLLSAKYALYGYGEYFHPLFNLKGDFEIVEVYNNLNEE